MTKLTKDVLNSPGVRYPVKKFIIEALHRDPVDAVNDAELIVQVLRGECDALIHAAGVNGR